MRFFEKVVTQIAAFLGILVEGLARDGLIGAGKYTDSKVCFVKGELVIENPCYDRSNKRGVTYSKWSRLPSVGLSIEDIVSTLAELYRLETVPYLKNIQDKVKSLIDDMRKWAYGEILNDK